MSQDVIVGPVNDSVGYMLKKAASTMRSAMDAALRTMQVNPANPAQATTTTVEEFPRYLSRDSTLIISMRSTSMTVESTLYKGWDHFRSVIRMALDARHHVSPVDGVERVGIRYVNEIRAPKDVGVDWTEWTQASLQAPKVEEEHPIDLPLALLQGLAVYGHQPGRAVPLPTVLMLPYAALIAISWTYIEVVGVSGPIDCGSTLFARTPANPQCAPDQLAPQVHFAGC